MPSSLSLPTAALYSFLLVLARISGAMVFIPIPGATAVAQPIRVILSLVVTLSLFPAWPAPSALPGIGVLAGWMLGEAAFGVAIGLLTGFLMESFVMFGQTLGLQAGYSFASVIDPNTQADSSILVVLAQTIAGLLFFATGLHLRVFAALAQSLTAAPPGSMIQADAARGVLRLAGTIFATGLRLAFPVIALLLMIDVALALLGRINSQLQLLSLAFPAKMMAALAMLIAVAAFLPRVYESTALRMFSAIPPLFPR